MRTVYFWSCFFFLFFPRLISAVADWMSTILRHMMWSYSKFRMQVWNVLDASRWKCRPKKSPKIGLLGTIAQLCWTISSQLRHVSTIGENLLDSSISPTCPHNMVNFGSLVAEIGLGVWGTAAKFNGFHVLEVLLHGTLVVGVRKLCGIEQRAPPIFGRAAIRLGIGPHSSYYYYSFYCGMHCLLRRWC